MDEEYDSTNFPKQDGHIGTDDEVGGSRVALR
jgi:hypothetical protein